MTGGRGAEFGKASPIGLFLILALLIAVVLLVRSMNRRLRNLPESFDDPDLTPGADAHALNNQAPMDDALPSKRAGKSAGESAVTMVKDDPKPDDQKPDDQDPDAEK
ncbi:hypothetical protein [Tomitella biformata]|uniref:hypothetical protein n=1 Tax=Tomitella biformata TaxID=630403 RepID=UPI001F43A519|nr:hypothetical protein [Tomitella biformata]